jgi:hypothetical protein
VIVRQSRKTMEPTPHDTDPDSSRPQRPVLFVNPKSGDGTASRAALGDRARERGIEVVILRPDQRLASLVGEAVAAGADALGMAGGDGSLAVVAAAAHAHDLPLCAFLRARATISRSTSASTSTTRWAPSTRSPTG